MRFGILLFALQSFASGLGISQIYTPEHFPTSPLAVEAYPGFGQYAADSTNYAVQALRAGQSPASVMAELRRRRMGFAILAGDPYALAYGKNRSIGVPTPIKDKQLVSFAYLYLGGRRHPIHNSSIVARSGFPVPTSSVHVFLGAFDQNKINVEHLRGTQPLAADSLLAADDFLATGRPIFLRESIVKGFAAMPFKRGSSALYRQLGSALFTAQTDRPLILNYGTDVVSMIDANVAGSMVDRAMRDAMDGKPGQSFLAAPHEAISLRPLRSLELSSKRVSVSIPEDTSSLSAGETPSTPAASTPAALPGRWRGLLGGLRPIRGSFVDAFSGVAGAGDVAETFWQHRFALPFYSSLSFYYLGVPLASTAAVAGVTGALAAAGFMVGTPARIELLESPQSLELERAILAPQTPELSRWGAMIWYSNMHDPLGGAP